MTQTSDDRNLPFILVIDDDTLLRNNLRDILEFAHYNVVTASSAMNGLRFLHDATRRPQLIICNVLNHDMNWLQFFQAICAEPQWDGMAFIFIVGIRDVSPPSHPAHEVKVVKFLANPSPIPALLLAIQDLLNKPTSS